VISAYIYYRIDPGQADLAASRIDALLNMMAAHCRQPPRRLSRCEDPDTWMEVYEDIIELTTFQAALNAAADRFDCAGFLQGERHLECFSAPHSPSAGNQSDSSTGTRAASAHSNS
jgi:hypothetical protein